MPGGRHDIETEADCALLVREFYEAALVDPVIGFLFTDIAKLDLERHLPRVSRFWATILLDAGSYSGGVFAKHLALNAVVPLRAGHFERWLALWVDTVDRLFVGDRAELAKHHAKRVARAFTERLAGIQERAAEPAGDDGELEAELSVAELAELAELSAAEPAAAKPATPVGPAAVGGFGLGGLQVQKVQRQRPPT